MSINVNVSGNPVSIRRGKMFMSDIEGFKQKETQRRRRARLDQVREQSKDFASELRNRHRTQTSSVLSDYEKTQSETLKKWSTKKLLNLQQQYNDCLENLGAAHAAASEETSPSVILTEQRKQNSKKANERGKKALKKLKDETQDRQEKAVLPKCRKVVNRRLENVRSKLVAGLNSPTRKRRLTRRSPVRESCPCVEYNPSNYESTEETSETIPSRIEVSNFKTKDVPFHSTAVQTNAEDRMRGGQPGQPNRSIHVESKLNSYVPFEPPPRDTRLSELIRRRKFTPIPEVREYNPNDYEVPTEYRPKTPEPHLVSRKEYYPNPPNSPTVCEPRHVEPAAICEENIPIHPRLEFTDTTSDYNNSQEEERIPNKPVTCYDHSNRFTHRYTPRTTLVQKTHRIPVQNLEEDTAHLKQLQKERDLLAKKRGNDALKRYQVQKDRQNLIKDLSNIHKDEQLRHIGRRNDGHLSEDRLKQKEKVRQRKIEAAFEEVYAEHTPLITLESEERIEGIDLPSRKVNVAWGLPPPKQESEKTGSLQDLLERVAVQRQLLKKEITHFKPISNKENDQSSSNRIVKEPKVKKPTKLKCGGSINSIKSSSTSLKGSTKSSSKIENIPSSKTVEVIVEKNGENSKNVVVENQQNSKAIQIIIKVDNPIEKIPAKPAMVSAATSPEPEKLVEFKENSTSTSYLSLPSMLGKDPKRVVDPTPINNYSRKPEVIRPKPIMFQVIHEPEESDRPETPAELPIETQQAINKLLAMSRNSIDNLQVSSSNVCTPDLEILQTSKNLSYDVSNSETHLSDSNLALSDVPLREGYTALAEFCTQRIDRLTEMIQQVRQDTQKLYPLEEDTSYLTLPPVLGSSPSIVSGDSQDIAGILKSMVQSNVDLNPVLNQNSLFQTCERNQQTNFTDPSSSLSSETESRKPIPVIRKTAEKYNVDLAGVPAKDLSTIVEGMTQDIDSLSLQG